MKYFIYLMSVLSTAVCYANAQSIQSLPSSASTTLLDSAQKAKVVVIKPYTSFSIISPADQETIQNQPDVTVSLKVEPALQGSDKIQVYVDGKAWGEPQAATTISLGRLDRGTHQLSAAIVDANHKVVKQSNSVTAYFQYAHVGKKS
jgi:hypothetical protein